MKRFFREVILYGAASSAGLAVDVFLLWALVEHLGLHYLFAASLAFVAGTAVVYALSIRAIFQYRRLKDLRIEFSSFAAIGLLGMLANLIVLRVAVETLGTHYLMGKMLSVVFTFSMNFGLRRYLLFSPSSDGNSATSRRPLA